MEGHTGYFIDKMSLLQNNWQNNGVLFVPTDGYCELWKKKMLWAVNETVLLNTKVELLIKLHVLNFSLLDVVFISFRNKYDCPLKMLTKIILGATKVFKRLC